MTGRQRIPSAFAVARALTSMMLDWNPLADPTRPKAHLEEVTSGFSEDDLLRTCGQLLTIIRAFAYELPAERRAMVMVELDALEDMR